MYTKLSIGKLSIGKRKKKLSKYFRKFCIKEVSDKYIILYIRE